jgi:shikimate kinase
LLKRTGRRSNRPLLAQGDPRAILSRLLDQRAPAYAEADIVVDSGVGPIGEIVGRIVEALAARRAGAAP